MQLPTKVRLILETGRYLKLVHSCVIAIRFFMGWHNLLMPWLKGQFSKTIVRTGMSISHDFIELYMLCSKMTKKYSTDKRTENYFGRFGYKNIPWQFHDKCICSIWRWFNQVNKSNMYNKDYLMFFLTSGHIMTTFNTNGRTGVTRNTYINSIARDKQRWQIYMFTLTRDKYVC